MRTACLSHLAAEHLIEHAARTAPRAYPPIVLCLHAGLRHQELVALRWADVSREPVAHTLRAGVLHPDEPGGIHVHGFDGGGRTIPVTQALLDVLGPPGDPAAAVFDRVPETLALSRLFRGARLPVPRTPWHALRLTCLREHDRDWLSLYGDCALDCLDRLLPSLRVLEPIPTEKTPCCWAIWPAC